MPSTSPLLECEPSLAPVQNTQSTSQHALQQGWQSAQAQATLQGQLCTDDSEYGQQVSKHSSLLLNRYQGEVDSNPCSLTGLNDSPDASLQVSCDIPALLVLLRLGLLWLLRPEQAQLVQSLTYSWPSSCALRQQHLLLAVA